MLSSNMVGNSDDETNFPHKLFLNNRQTLEKHLITTHQLILNIQKLTKIEKGGFLKF